MSNVPICIIITGLFSLEEFFITQRCLFSGFFLLLPLYFVGNAIRFSLSGFTHLLLTQGEKIWVEYLVSVGLKNNEGDYGKMSVIHF